MGVVVRQPGPGERAEWERRWQAYLAFYETELPPAVTDNTWTRLHDPEEPLFVLGAYLDGKLAGIAHYLFHRTNWSISDVCYLQDLFVDPAARQHGIGRALIDAVADKAREAGASRLYWMTHETNATARSLYDKLAERSGFIQYRRAL
jgi:GNAT superfamily N-acetyltransferase